MSYELTFKERPSFLHAVVTGSNSKENVRNYLEDIMHECLARGCSRVLIEEKLDGPRLPSNEVIEIVSTDSGRALGLFNAIAYVDVNAESSLMTFAGSVARKRGLPIEVFPNVEEAEKWLEAIDT